MPTLNLIAWDNGVGLTRDLRLLAGALERAGFEVHLTPIGRGKLRKWFRPLLMHLRLFAERLRHGSDHYTYDANLMLEHIRTEDIPFARRNFFVPNPEWCLWSDVSLLPRVDAVLTKTLHADSIFGEHGHRVAHIGFTSEDRFDPAVKRERTFFHLAGRSKNKGTQRLMELWSRHPEWPRLTVVQSPREAKPIDPPVANIDHRVDYVDDAELRRLQNANWFHLCLSETEGFGHYLVEAMGVGAVTITTDAAPMNELVQRDRGVLVGYNATGIQHLATTYFFDEHLLEAEIQRLLAAPEAELQLQGAAAREWFLANDRGFSRRLAVALEPLLS